MPFESTSEIMPGSSSSTCQDHFTFDRFDGVILFRPDFDIFLQFFKKLRNVSVRPLFSFTSGEKIAIKFEWQRADWQSTVSTCTDYSSTILTQNDLNSIWQRRRLEHFCTRVDRRLDFFRVWKYAAAVCQRYLIFWNKF